MGKSRSVKVVWAVVGFAFLAGCGSLARIDPLFEAEPEAVDLDTGEPNALYIAALDSANPQIAQANRNELQSLLLRRSEQICEIHQSDIFANAAVFNVTMGVLTSALAGAAAIVTGPVGIEVLAGGAALSNAGRSLVNEEVYRQQLVTAVITEIDENRKAVREEIGAKLDKTTADYAVNESIRDAQRYHQECSFFAGVSSLVGKAGQRVAGDLPGLTATAS